MQLQRYAMFIALTVMLSVSTFGDVIHDAYEALKEAAISEDADFESALETATNAGLPTPLIVELKTLNYLRNGDLEGLFEVLPELVANQQEIPISIDNVFRTSTDLQGFIAALQSIQAFEQSDMERFEINVKEAFWLAPQFANMFQLGQMIQQYRQETASKLAMENLIIPMDLKLEDIDGNQLTVGEMLEGKTAILIDFWASWCGPCMAAMPSLQEKHEKLSPKGIVVLALNTDDQDQKQKAVKVKTDKNMDMPWFLEPEDRPLSRLLNVDSIPRMVLITPDGKVLYNGHPLDPSLDSALQQLMQSQ